MIATEHDTQPRRVGRPPLPPDRVLCHRIEVWMDDETLAWCIAQAGTCQSLSSFLRRMVKLCAVCDRYGGCDGSCNAD